MNRRLRWKFVIILAFVVVTSAIAWFPPLAQRAGVTGPEFLTRNRLLLGLDLKGGVQFVLRVNVDEVLGTDPLATREDIVAQAKEAVDRRVNALGVVEPVILVQGADRNELLIQLPGFTDVDRARAILGATAKLEWRLVEAGPAPAINQLAPDGTIADDVDALLEARSKGAGVSESPSYYLVNRTAEVGGRDIRHAVATHDEVGRPAVGFSLTADGGRRFADLTSRSIGRQLAIVLDDRVQSAPVIESAIAGGEGIIRGGFSNQEAADFALLLRSGALPVSMTFLGGQYVGPTLGARSVHAGLAASLAGLVLVAGFMLVYYRRAGVNAVVSIFANLALLLGLMAAIGAAVSLPGVAGLILTIGIGVDSNVLIFERIKDELRAGQPLRRAIAAGFDRVFLTILDTHVCTLVAAAFLFQFGSGAIRGFATTLTLGLLTNLFTAVLFSRTLFELTLSGTRAWSFGARLDRSAPMRRAIDIMGRSRLALMTSAAIVLAALTVTAMRGLPLGLDFTGGTAVVAQFSGPVTEDDVRSVIPGPVVVQRYGEVSERSVQIRIPRSADSASDGDDPRGVQMITAALSASNLPAAEPIGSTSIGPAAGAEMQRKGAVALVGALGGTMAYLALRFRPGFAAGAAVAVVHDLVVTTAALTFCGYSLDLNVVAALLTVAGYSVNDTIVIFDRVRERLRSIGKGGFAQAANQAVGDTLGRTLITSGTTLVAVLALYLFGGPALRGFSFTVLVGILVGTWSSVVVAVPVAALWSRPASGVARHATL